ncbi:MAG: carboxy terminal-processing peptidase [Saprospiraceae bacterium]
MNRMIWLKTISIFLCFNVMFIILGLRFKEAPGDKYDVTLHEVVKTLKQYHVSPQEINDSLSAKIFTDYLERMDGERNIFIQSDILRFNEYKFSLDDELNGETIRFFYIVKDTYKKRVTELQNESPAWFKNPAVYTTNSTEYYYPINKNHPATISERTARWKSKVKYHELEKYAELKEVRDLSTVDSVKLRSDITLEVEARASTETIIKKVISQYNTQYTDDELFSMYVNSFVNRMDPHSDYFLPVEKRSWNESLSGKFYGIGAQIGEENGFLKLSVISVGGPAWRSGEVEAGDLILKVGQGDEKPVDVAGFSIPDGVKLIRGVDKTVVSLTLKKADGTVKVVKLIREELKIEETFARSNILNYKDKKYGIINLPKFYTSFGDEHGRSCSDDVAKELERLKSNNVDGVIVDLRNNGGGSLQEVVNMVGLFIPQGPVVQVKGKTGRPGVYFDRDGKTTYDGPLMVMVNEFSASASEIFAAAIQDYRRGLIIGSGTYGKGTVQRPYNMNATIKGPDLADNDTNGAPVDLGSIHITMQKYYRINGSSVQMKGVVPDIRLNGYYESYKVKEKDEETALPWDELSKLQYTTWQNIPDLVTMQKRFSSTIDTANVFATFDENSKWLAAQNDLPKSISESAYKQQVKMIRDKSTFNRNLMRLPEDLDVYGIYDSPQVKDSAQVDKIKIDRNNRITNYYKRDHYLQITADLLTEWLKTRPLMSSTNN